MTPIWHACHDKKPKEFVGHWFCIRWIQKFIKLIRIRFESTFHTLTCVLDSNPKFEKEFVIGIRIKEKCGFVLNPASSQITIHFSKSFPFSIKIFYLDTYVRTYIWDFYLIQSIFDLKTYLFSVSNNGEILELVMKFSWVWDVM